MSCTVISRSFTLTSYQVQTMKPETLLFAFKRSGKLINFIVFCQDSTVFYYVFDFGEFNVKIL